MKDITNILGTESFKEKVKSLEIEIDSLSDELYSRTSGRCDFNIIDIEYDDKKITATAKVVGSQYPFHFEIPFSWINDDCTLNVEIASKEIGKEIIEYMESEIKKHEKLIEGLKQDIKNIKNRVGL